MKLNSMMKLATVAALVGGTTGCLGTGTDYSYVVSKTADDGAATVTTGSGTTATANVSFANEIKPLLKNPTGGNKQACINCHVGVLTTANLAVSTSTTTLQNMGVKSNFMMAVVNPTTTDGKTLAGSGTTAGTVIGSATVTAAADPATLDLTTSGGNSGRLGWNCEPGDYPLVANGGTASLYSIRTLAIAKLSSSTANSLNLGSRLLEKIGGSTYGLTSTRMPKALTSQTVEYFSASQLDTFRTWIAQGAPCNN